MFSGHIGGDLLHQSGLKCSRIGCKSSILSNKTTGPVRDSNPRPLAPKARIDFAYTFFIFKLFLITEITEIQRIITLDQQAVSD